MQKLTPCELKEIIKEELQELDYTNMDLSRTASKEPAQHRIRVKPDRAEEAAKLLQQNGIDFHDYYKASGGFVVFTFVKRWNRDDAFQVLKKQGLTIQGQFSENIGWDNLPDGWDKDSVDSFARSLTDKTKDDSEGFFSACMDEVEDKFDDPEAFCASLKDEYLDTTDWRGKDESANKPKNMKLTESRLRQLIKEEARRLRERDEMEKFENLKDRFPGGGMVTRRVGGNLWDDVERRLLNHTDTNQRYLNNFEAFYVSDVGALNRNDFDNVEVWGSFEDPKGSMTPTERVNFHRIHP